MRAKVAAVIERANFQRTSHDHSRLLNLLQLFPRDELFQIEIDELESMAMAMPRSPRSTPGESAGAP